MSNKSALVNPINIAIDGYSSCGKSTLAQDLAKALNYTYIDSGAMYRAVTLFLLNHELVRGDEVFDVKNALSKIEIEFKFINNENITHLNGQNVEKEIRGMLVSENVSVVAAIPEVRRKLVEHQQLLGINKGVVMDGRDIGTVVFPTAELKIFVTADIETRTKRRFDELQASHVEVSFEEIKTNLHNRDFIDSTREDSPLHQADDAILIDNTHMTIEEQFQKVLNLAKSKIRKGSSS